MDFRDFLEADVGGTHGQGVNASGQRGASEVSPGKPKAGVNPPGGPFGDGGPKSVADKKNVEPPASPLAGRYRTAYKPPETSKLSPTGIGQPVGPMQPISPSAFVSRYMMGGKDATIPSNAKKGAAWPKSPQK